MSSDPNAPIVERLRPLAVLAGDDAMDELIHTAASKAASDANNDGPSGQLLLMLGTFGWSEEDLARELRSMIPR